MSLLFGDARVRFEVLLIDPLFVEVEVFLFLDRQRERMAARLTPLALEPEKLSRRE